MKKTRTLMAFTFGCLLVLLCTVGWNVLQSTSVEAQVTPKWEYMILGGIKNGFGETVGTSTKALNDAGRQSWEAVGFAGNGATLLKRRLK